MKVEEVVEILKAVFPKESKIVGELNLRDIAEGSSFDDATGGSYIDLNQYITLLASVTTIIQGLYTLIQIHYIEKKKETDMNEIVKMLIEEKSIPNNIKEEQVLLICTEILARLKSR